jgi:uncharacterized protein YbjT (DUF2867 family)
VEWRAVKVLVLGSYGLIGRVLVRALAHAGHGVTGLGRSSRSAARAHPDIPSHTADLADLTEPGRWAPYLLDVDAVVNASGALQSGARDDLPASQARAIVALVAACETAGVQRFVQISSPGAGVDADTAFLRTKGEADAALRGSTLAWTLLRPGLVIAPEAYGGTALLRALAAMPGIVALTHAPAPVQCVDVDDVARAVCRCLDDDALAGAEFDLVEEEPRSLEALVLAVRGWLGIAAPSRVLRLPAGAAALASRVADGAGRLGWRSPLRTTAVTLLARGVLGDPQPWAAATGESPRALPEILAARPATRHDRVDARLSLLLPPLLAMLSLLWLVSGLVALWQPGTAAAELAGVMPDVTALALVIAGALLDLVIGVALLIRRTARHAALASLLICALYLVAGTVLTPWLWIDPLGPLLKILPAMGLSLVLWLLLDER